MRKTVIAKVKWIPKEHGGLPVLPPTNGKYYPIICFNDNTSNRVCSWDAEILCTGMDSNYNSIIELSYLLNEAPFENLKSGNTFRLYDDKRLVAEGIIQ